jgi:cysteine desulfurase/selenocysteine lyase
MFSKERENAIDKSSTRLEDFSYIRDSEINMDAACQTMRPIPVIDALNEYYKEFNACGERVQYKWGKIVDQKVRDVRSKVLKFVDLLEKEYTVSFTLNTTYGLNLLLNSIEASPYNKVVTSEIEHNSVFLSTIHFSKKYNLERTILNRDVDGSLIYDTSEIKNAVIVVNATSNIDGRRLINIKDIVKDAHHNGSIVIIDAAQTMGHFHHLLDNCGADAICFSAHKMYASSLGVMIIKNTLLDSLKVEFVGGGMVSNVTKNDYVLLDERETRLEPGLQAYGEIISLGAAIDWLRDHDKNAELELSKTLYDGLSEINNLHIINHGVSPVISAYTDNLDANLIATSLSNSGVMVRSGYFCCHYYLIEKMKYPKLLRFSIGLHNTSSDIDKAVGIMKKISKGF